MPHLHSSARTSAKRSKPVHAAKAAHAKPRPIKRTTPAKASPTRNHKSLEAKLERDALDEKVIRLLSQKRHQAEGLLKTNIATELGADASDVKASLNRLVEAKLVSTNGTTMNTKYVAVKDAVGKLKEMRRAKDKPSAKQPSKTPAKRAAKRQSPAKPPKQAGATRSAIKTGSPKDDEEE